ncbi:hypothetical protein B0T24DRAFT_595029 [Lasiosphaeria ovina]|uniref:Uncharacterized protein n=1 Tax=Lasiosphaeria ovina TaxID=92902 RepID=A0AAE0N562_9PEZI|nr:hypothetical protein B0T24DRAFT_595029 [Lasiosphaeria ovina]
MYDDDNDSDSYSPPRHRDDSSRHGGHRSSRRSPAGAGRARSPATRDLSPDYQFSGGTFVPSPYAHGAIPIVPPVAAAAASAPRLHYEQHTPFYPPGAGEGGLHAGDSLQVPRPRDYRPQRPRSVPPPGAIMAAAPRGQQVRHRRDDLTDSDDDGGDHRRDHSRSHSPLGKARHVLEHTFSQSTSGLGVGVLGAIVGGLAAREVSERGHRNGGSGSKDSSKGVALISTIVGAAVGGLGANAIEKRLERSHSKTNREQDAWERKWGPSPGDNNNNTRDVGRSGDRRVPALERDARDRGRAQSSTGRDRDRSRSRADRRRGGSDYDDDGDDDSFDEPYEERVRPGRKPGGLADDYYAAAPSNASRVGGRDRDERRRH